MNAATTIKEELIHWIEDLEDEALIEELRAIKDDRSTSIEWNHLPEHVKADIRKGQAQARTGEGLTSEEMWDELNRRRKQY